MQNNIAGRGGMTSSKISLTGENAAIKIRAAEFIRIVNRKILFFKIEREKRIWLCDIDIVRKAHDEKSVMKYAAAVIDLPPSE